MREQPHAARNDEFLLLDALGDILDIVEGWTPRTPAEKIEAVREVIRRLDVLNDDEGY